MESKSSEVVEETVADRNTEGAKQEQNAQETQTGKEKPRRERDSGGGWLHRRKAEREKGSDGGKVTRVCESDRQAGRKGRL